MAHNHSNHNHSAHTGHKALGSHAAKGAAMSAGAHTGKSIIRHATKHPLVLIGLGMIAGYYAHKYRKEIISSVSGAADRGKDFVLQQKENLEDIVAETKEGDDNA